MCFEVVPWKQYRVYYSWFIAYNLLKDFNTLEEARAYVEQQKSKHVDGKLVIELALRVEEHEATGVYFEVEEDYL